MDIKPDREKLTKAFDHMVETVSHSIRGAEEALAPTIEEMVQNAQKITADLFELSKKESERLGKALKRDIQSANKALNQQGKEIKDWLSFDLTLVEDKFVELIALVADKTWLDLRSFESDGRPSDSYRTGEVCNAGTLCCRNCVQTIKMTKTSHIPPCPHCHHTEFYRVVS